MESIAGISNNESIAWRHKCQLLYFKCYSLQRQTLDHDPLATVFLGHFRDRASLYCFILTHTHTHKNAMYNTPTSITFTQMSWQRSGRESDSVDTDIKEEGWSEKRRTLREKKQTALGLQTLWTFTLREHSIMLLWAEQMAPTTFTNISNQVFTLCC